MIRTAATTEDALGESPLWHPAERALYWLDVARPRLHRLAPDGGVATLALAAAAPLGSIVAADRPGTLVLAGLGGLSLLDAETGRLAPFADPEEGRDGVGFNDGKVDRWGRLWIGTHDLKEEAPRGVLWCLAPGARPVLADAGFAVSNGPAFSPDGATLYFSDSVGRRILAYDLRADDPRPTGRRVFATMAIDEGYPDGLTVDADGCLWVAHWDGWRLTRFAPDGERLAVVPMPVPRPTSVAFGGEGLATLHVTSARLDLGAATLAAAPNSGCLFAFEPGVRGLPERPFALPADAGPAGERSGPAGERAGAPGEDESGALAAG